MANAVLAATFPSSVRYVSRDLRPVAAGAVTFSGGLACANPGGTNPGYYGEATGALGERVVGRFYGKYGAVNNATGIAGALFAEIEFFHERKLYLVNNDDGTTSGHGTPVTAAQRETMISVLNDNAGTQDLDGARADLGIFYDFSEDGSGMLWVEFVYPSSSQDEGPAPSPGGSNAFVARAVANQNLAAYTGTGTGTLTASANGAIGAQDGVTLAAGDILILRIDCTNLAALSDAGPYVVTALGGASARYVLTRPSWWFTGTAIPSGKSIDVSEGTLFNGTSWRTSAVKGKIVDTDDPILFPKSVTLQVTMNGASPSLFTITTVPMRSATKSNAIAMYAGGGTPAATTLAYQPGVITPSTTLGAASSVTISAVKAQMVGVNTDTALVNVTLVN